VAIAQAGQIAKRDLDLDAMATEPAWVADEGPDVMPGIEQRREEGPADGSTRPCKQDHAAALYPRIATRRKCRLRAAKTPGGRAWTIRTRRNGKGAKTWHT
jgi:hypothetical protein